MAITKEELRDAFTRNGYTAASFAEAWHVHPDTVYRWGNGSTPRWVMTILTLMDQLGRERIERCSRQRQATTHGQSGNERIVAEQRDNGRKRRAKTSIRLDEDKNTID